MHGLIHCQSQTWTESKEEGEGLHVSTPPVPTHFAARNHLADWSQTIDLTDSASSKISRLINTKQKLQMGTLVHYSAVFKKYLNINIIILAKSIAKTARQKFILN